ncbi:PGN_0703 family putative restriction endonuclease [Granulicella tundricola]|nr:hypothetical protein [Granulicella tundricola]
MRDIEPVRPTPRRTNSPAIRQDLIRRNLTRAAAHPHDQTRSSIIYAPTETAHGNFIDASYRRIQATPDWQRRLTKPHTAKRHGRLSEVRDTSWCELDTATSSDALLMNIFCYPRVLATASLPALLGIDPGQTPIFGHKPHTPLHRNLTDTTEIDMKLGPLLVEAKLTETDFQSAPIRKLQRYRDLEEVFNLEDLKAEQGTIRSYQLIRGVLAAHVHQASFCVLCDARRPDLIESWFQVMRAVRFYDLRARLRIHTWQELARALPVPLKVFLAQKYGIESA